MKCVSVVISIVLAATLASAGSDFGHMAIIGDSITQASGSAYASSVFPQNQCRGYRWELFKALLDAGAAFDFNGSIANNYIADSMYPTWRGTAFYRANEGHFGWRAREVLNGPDAARLGSNRGTGGVAQWLDNSNGGYTPDTATIMIGINDLSDYINVGTTNAANAMVGNYVAGIISALQTSNPNVRIYLCHLLHIGSGHAQYVPLNCLVDDYNANQLPGLALAMTTAHSSVSVVDLIGPTNNGANLWIARTNGWNPNAGEMTGVDNVHPNSRGERFIAGRIASALGLTSSWTSVIITNGNFEAGFINRGTSNCAPSGWTLYGTPSGTAVPKQVADYQVVAESIVDNVATGTGSSGSSYIIAGNADTGIKQTLAETLTAGRHYMLQTSLFSGSAALTSGDWGVEIWAGGTKLAQADNQVLLKTYAAGTAYQIGSALTEVPVEFDANDFPALLGQPLEIRLISRNNTRYVGFEDLRLSWKPSPTNAPQHYQIYVLTGQSNSLGTDSGTEINKLPGCDPADTHIPFWWHNVSGDIYGISASPGYSVGSSLGFWKPLQAQFAFNVYANIGNAFGPEVNFARTMYYSGQTNIAVIKASRGGGGNSFWLKSNADNHMYVLVTNTVMAACNRLAAEGHTFEIAGLLYLQGESDSAGESAAAGTRFKSLVDNLRVDLPNAAVMKGYMVGNLTTAATRAAQEAVAAQYPSYLFYCDSQDLTNEWVADNLHQNKKAKLINGARLAQLVLGRAAHFDASEKYGGVFGQPYGNGAAGVTPFTGLTTVTTGHSPIFQGWAETPNTAQMAAAITAATNQAASSINDSSPPAWTITDGDSTGTGYFYSRKFTGPQGTNFAGSGWVYSLTARFPAGYANNPSFCIQYGDASTRWLVQVKRDLSGTLTAIFTNGGAVKTVVLQSGDDSAYHNLKLRKSGGGSPNAELVFDGLTLGSVAAAFAGPALEPGVHFGTRDPVGKGAVNIASVDFSAATVTASNLLIYLPGVNGSISGNATQNIAYAASGQAVTAAANSNFVFTGWSDGRTDNPRTDTNLVFSLSVAANFVTNSFTLTYLAGTNGNLAGASVQTVTYRGSGTAVAALPDSNYIFSGWSDGLTSNPRMDTNISDNLTVTANFLPGNVTLIYLAGPGGTISGIATQNVAYAGTGTAVTATPDVNCFFSGWNDGATVNPRTDTNVTSNATLMASFAPVVSGGLFWDGGVVDIGINGDGSSQGGAGIWSTTLTNWDQGSGRPHTSWGSAAIAVFGGAGGTVSLESAITAGGILNAAASDLALPGAFGLTFNGPVNVGTQHNLTIGNADSGIVNLSAATLTGSTTLTINKITPTATSAFNSTNALNFNGTLRLRGGNVSTAPGAMGTLYFWLHAPVGTQAAGTTFALDTGASPDNGMDFILGDWDANSGNRKLTLSSLTGYGTLRTDAGVAGVRHVIVNQAGDTTFNGMLLSHTSGAGTVRGVAFEKLGNGSLTMANIIGKETASAGSASSDVTLTITAGTQVLAATNTLTGSVNVNGGSLVINGIHPATSPITVAAAGKLAGTGVINGLVTNYGILSPGNPLGSLTFSNAPVLNGTVQSLISRSSFPNAGKVIAGNALAYSGTLTVTNVGQNNFSAGDSFVLFGAPGFSGHFSATNLPVLNSGLGWVWTATNGTLAVIQTVNPNPTNLVWAANGNWLQFSWPVDHIGWTLEFQTNLSTSGPGNWQIWPGSANTNSITVSNSLSSGALFFRLRFP